MTLYQLLEEGRDELRRAGDPDAGEDARRLLLAVFRLDTVHFLLDRMQMLPDEEAVRSLVRQYREMIAERVSRRPLQHILGSQEFMGLEFYVNQHVLIPRQDTETLVERVLEEQDCVHKKILDLCTGSGCIAISLAVKGGCRDVTAADISGEALEVARRNVERHGCSDRVCLCRGDLFEALEAPGGRASAAGPEGARPVFDVITSNPPYIPTAAIRTLEPEVRDYEPALALDGTEDGLWFYQRIASGAKTYLAEGGMLYLEIGHDQGEAARDIFKAGGYQDIRICKDLPGNDRVLCARG